MTSVPCNFVARGGCTLEHTSLTSNREVVPTLRTRQHFSPPKKHRSSSRGPKRPLERAGVATTGPQVAGRRARQSFHVTQLRRLGVATHPEKNVVLPTERRDRLCVFKLSAAQTYSIREAHSPDSAKSHRERARHRFRRRVEQSVERNNRRGGTQLRRASSSLRPGC